MKRQLHYPRPICGMRDEILKLHAKGYCIKTICRHLSVYKHYVLAVLSQEGVLS